MFSRNHPGVAHLLPVLFICCRACSICLGAEAPHAERRDLARRILADTGVRGGLIVQVGCGDGRLTAALAASEAYLVQGLDADAANVEQARKHVHSLGLYGKVSVNQFEGKRLPYADNLVNLLVAEHLGDVAMEEVMRVLVPLGVAYVKTDQKWTKTIKLRPNEIDEWTHWLHGADGNAVAEDTIVGPPRRMQWIAKPYWSRHHHTVPSVTGFVSTGGRVFYVVDEAPAGMDGSAPDQWALIARDAFNGLPLWRKPMPEWGWKTWSDDWLCRFTIPTHVARRLVALGDRVYVTLGFNEPLRELDAATGEVLRTFAGSQLTDEILLHDGQLILAVNQDVQRPGVVSQERRGETGPPPVRKAVALLDVESGKTLWKTGDYVGLRSKTGSMERISHLSMCAGDGRVFFVDGDAIVALSLGDGRQLWRARRPEIPEHRMRYNIRLSDMCSLVYHGGVVYFAQLNPDKRVGWRGVRGRLHAFSATSGKELWNRQCASWGWGHPADVFVVDGLVWVHDFQPPSILGLDPKTGRIKRQLSNFKAFDNGHHHRCYRNKATTRFMITSYRGLEFIDFAGRVDDKGGTDLNHWVRGTCRLGAFPCNGLIYATPHPCSCYISSKLNGFLALAPEAESSSAEPDSHKLQRGPAYGEIRNPKSEIRNSSNWPMYRHDRRRSGAATTSLSADLKKVWEVDLGGRPTGCVAVGDTVLVAVPDSHQVVALCATDGKRSWTFTAGGRIDTPPTIDRGRAYFGCADGWLYCLRMSDGRLVWRFRGAPQERLVGALDGIESAWPIHGSPLVEDGVVYLTAGRSSFLDGGILAFALDARTGKIISRRKIASEHSMEVDAGTDRLVDSGLLADLLVGQGDSIHMRQRQIFPKMETSGGTEARRAGATAAVRTTCGMLDDEWFSRARWYLGDRPVAEYLVFNDTTVYGVRARDVMTGYGGFVAPGKEGYELFAADLAAVMGVDAKKVANAGKKEYGIGIPKRWSIRVPVRVTAMTLAGDVLFAAGSPDAIDQADPWAAYEGRRGGKLLALSAGKGKILAQYQLDAPPVLDAVAASGGRLLVSTIDGKILCYAEVLIGSVSRSEAGQKPQPTVAIVCPADAESPVRIAAQELAEGLGRLYKDEVFGVFQRQPPSKSVSSNSYDGPPRPSKQQDIGQSTGSEAHRTAESEVSRNLKPGSEVRRAIYLGTPASLPKLAGPVADRLHGTESYVVTTGELDGRTVGLIVGGDPRGVMYGVHGLLQKLGYGYYLGVDAPPAPRSGPFGFDGWDLADRPLVPTRIMFNWHNFLSSCSTWNLEHWQQWTTRSQKMGFNTIMVHAYGNNPMSGFRFRGVDKPVGYLGSTRLGRSWFVNHVNDVRQMHGAEVFDKPVFGSTAAVDGTSGERTKAARRLMREVFEHAERRGVRVIFAFDIDTPPGNPQELITLLDESERFPVQGRWLPNPDTPGGYAFYKAQVAGLLAAYPQIDTLALWHRSGGTPWMGYKHEDMPEAWQNEFDAACRKTPGTASSAAGGTEKLWHARHMFGMAKVAAACQKALSEIGRADVSIAFGSWHYSFLAGADRFMPQGVTLIPLDWMVLVDQSQLRDADSRAVIGRVAEHRPVLPIVWAHHDDGAYVMSPFKPLDNFQDRLDDARCTAHGYGIIHWMTRPLDLYFASLARQTWSQTRNEPFETTCRRAAGHWFDPAHRHTLGRYLQQWVEEAPRFARETSDWFVDRPLDEPGPVARGIRSRVGLLDEVDPAKMRSAAKERLEYFRGIEKFTGEVHRLESTFREVHRLLGQDQLDDARQLAESIAEQPQRVIREFADTVRLGGITRGEQGLVVTLNTRWLPHYVGLRQRLRLAPIRYNFGPTVHDPIAPRPGKFTFHFDPQKRIWQTLGQQETGAKVFTFGGHKKPDPGADAPAGIDRIVRQGLEITKPLTVSLRPIMYGAYGGKGIKQSPDLPVGKYRLTLWTVPPTAPGERAFQLFVTCGGEVVGQFAKHTTIESKDPSPVFWHSECEVTIETPGEVKFTVEPSKGRVLLGGAVLEPVH